MTANIQKLEKKKTSSLEEYKSNVLKYNSIRDELEKRFNDSCQVFQVHEELHLKQMQVFMLDYFRLINELNDSRKRIFIEIQAKQNAKYSNDYLLQQMVISRRVGIEIPKRLEFVEYADSRDTRLTALKSNSIPILRKSLCCRKRMTARALLICPHRASRLMIHQNPSSMSPRANNNNNEATRIANRAGSASISICTAVPLSLPQASKRPITNAARTRNKFLTVHSRSHRPPC